ncbi:DivIVA domain-containing protein [Algoriphagus sp. D3-2-R+10]|uniref:DivIVA domain-containing protein n=1 Tax=Algoriphagus aurantiacus TaxID=3103948 RepID=UPI002B37EE63|nr:DivIVA domain-containing protein [Algoriphagus sp. D3-2-R+10]MEB2777216.1 DivIVA domain-containing protein [Algoriphagus sp. D3-2-R+10]
MKITPAAIRQKTFEVGFRGYEKKEVTIFLDEISEVVDQLHKENMELKTKLQNTEAEAKRLKDVEESLFRTLKTAEDTGAAIIVEANEAADLIIADANETADNATKHIDQLIADSRKQSEDQAAAIIGAAETKAKKTIVELRESMQGLVRSYEGLAEQRESMVKSLKRIAQDTLNQIDLSEAHYTRIDAKAHARAIDELSRSQTFTFANLENLGYEEEISEEEIEENPLEEMEVIEEQLEIEAHDSTPDLEMKTDEAEVAEEELEMEDTKMQLEDESLEEDIEELEEAKQKPIVETVKPQAVQPKYPENPKNQSGSFFDQFD